MAPRPDAAPPGASDEVEDEGGLSDVIILDHRRLLYHPVLAPRAFHAN